MAMGGGPVRPALLAWLHVKSFDEVNLSSYVLGRKLATVGHLALVLHFAGFPSQCLCHAPLPLQSPGEALHRGHHQDTVPCHVSSFPGLLNCWSWSHGS